MSRTDIAFILWLLPWALLAILALLGLCPLGYVYGYGLVSLVAGIPMALSPRLRQLVFLVVWRLGFQEGNTSRARKQWVRDAVPWVFKQPGKVLYVGLDPDHEFLVPELFRAGNELTVLEIWPASAAHYKKDSRLRHIVCGDVRNVPLSEHYDAAVWWHGPEHLQKGDVRPALKQLEALADTIVVGCPWGENRADGLGNPYMVHVSAWYPEEFETWGYEIIVGGERDVMGGNLMAWKGGRPQ